MSSVVIGTGFTTAPRLRITKRGYTVLTVAVAIPLVAAAFGIALNSGGAVATDSTTSTSFEHVTVQSGETLWQLATSIAPKADPRDVIADIVQLNQLDGSTLQPGQRIAVPLQYSK
jgi:LysM repeat protein